MPADHGQLDATQIVNRQFFKARRHGTCFLEPADATFNDIAAPVLLRIEGWRSASPVPDLVKPLGNDSTDPVSSQPLPDAAMTVRSISGHLLWSAPVVWPVDAHGIQDWFSVQRLTRLPG